VCVYDVRCSTNGAEELDLLPTTADGSLALTSATTFDYLTKVYQKA